LTNLNIGQLDFDEMASLFPDFLNNVKEVYLNNNLLWSYSQLNEILIHCPSIEKINLSYNMLEDQIKSDTIVHNRACENLKCLALNNCFLGNDTLKILLKSLFNLKELRISKNQVSNISLDLNQICNIDNKN